MELEVKTTDEIRTKRITIGDPKDLEFLQSEWVNKKDVLELIEDFADFRMPFRYKQRIVNEWRAALR